MSALPALLYIASLWVYIWATPWFVADVTDEILASAGFRFERPAAAQNACLARVGHGLGDTCTYLSFDLPEASLADFLQGLGGCQQVGSSKHFKRPYTERLPVGIAGMIWPESPPENATLFETNRGFAMYDHGNQRLHLAEF